MNIVKSAFVILLLCILFLWAIKSTISFIKVYRYGAGYWGKLLLMGGSCFITLCVLVISADYTYPFERNVNLELVTVVESDEPFVNPGIWHGIYGEYGMYPGSGTFHPNHADKWIKLDLEHYSYIVSYGQEVESLTYNVWDTIDAPFSTGAKAGHIKLSNEFAPSKIYIYQIRKIRIDNVKY